MRASSYSGMRTVSPGHAHLTAQILESRETALGRGDACPQSRQCGWLVPECFR